MNPKTPPDPFRLQALFDQELAPDEAQEVRESLSEDDRLRLQALGEIQLLTQTRAAQEADVVDLSGLWSRIESRLEPSASKPASASKSASKPASVSAPVSASMSAGSSGSGWIDKLASLLGLDRRVVVPVLSVVAIVLLVMLPQMMNRRPQSPPTNPSINPAPSAATNNNPSINPPTTASNPPTDPPQIIVIFNPTGDQPNQDWLVKYPRPQTPVIWYTGGETAPNVASPNALPPALWPAIQEAIKDIQNQATAPQNGSPTSNPNGPNNDPI